LKKKDNTRTKRKRTNDFYRKVSQSSTRKTKNWEARTAYKSCYLEG